jgi:hypothetical protein
MGMQERRNSAILSVSATDRGGKGKKWWVMDSVEMTLTTLRKKRATGRGTHMLLIFHRREKDKIEENNYS